MEIPLDRLPSDTLRALLIDFVTRDGTADVDQDVKVKQVEAQLRAGKAYIEFDMESESFDIKAR